jgi:hypothetical protein
VGKGRGRHWDLPRRVGDRHVSSTCKGSLGRSPKRCDHKDGRRNAQSALSRIRQGAEPLPRGTVTSEAALKAGVKGALSDGLITLAQAGVRDSNKGRFSIGQALDWSRMDFRARQTEMRRVLRDTMRQRSGSLDDGDHLIVRLAGTEILIVPNAIPAAITVSAARELVGQPFLRDHELADALKLKRGGPVHVIACHKTATESQATKLLGFPDATVVSDRFGIFVADNIQKVQFAFMVNCRDDANTRNNTQSFFAWLSQTGEEKLLAERATARARIVRAIAKEAGI